jgi:GNAT superfamily N-acetyltransferase
VIRPALESDIPRLLEMGSRSLREGPYKGKIIDNPEVAAALAFQVIKNQQGQVLVAEEGGQLIGLLGYAIFPHYYTGEKTAAEIMWWVEPEHRRSFTALALFRRAEAEARQAGCATMQFTAPTEEVARAYEKMGYTALEVAYYKDLN